MLLGDEVLPASARANKANSIAHQPVPSSISPASPSTWSIVADFFDRLVGQAGFCVRPGPGKLAEAIFSASRVPRTLFPLRRGPRTMWCSAAGRMWKNAKTRSPLYRPGCISPSRACRRARAVGGLHGEELTSTRGIRASRPRVSAPR